MKNEHLHVRRWSLAALLAFVAAVGFGASAKPASAVSDPLVTGVTIVSSTSTTTSATANYDIRITSTQAIPANTPLSFNFNSADFSAGEFNLSSATIGRVAQGGSVTTIPSNAGGGMISVTTPSQIAAGNSLFRISNVTNPSRATAYNVFVSTEDQSQPQEGFGQQTQGMPSAPNVIGTGVLFGVFTQSDGATPIANSGVNLHDDTFSKFVFGNTNAAGTFSMDISSVIGAVKLEVFLDPRNAPSGQSAPDPIALTLAGATVRQDIALITASKTLVVTVKYKGTGAAVTTAQVSAFRPGAAGNASASVNASGQATLSLAQGGSWQLNVMPAFNEQTGQQQTVDWIQPFGEPISANFKDDKTVETVSVTIEVDKADATIKGTVKDTNGNLYNQGSVDIRSTNGMGTSSGIQNGAFQVSVQAGSYSLSVWTNNSELYNDEVKVTVEKDQTLDVGVIQLKKRNSKITGKVMDKDTGAGVASLRVRAFQVGGGFGWADDETDSSGNYELFVNPGKWGVQIDTFQRQDPNATPGTSTDSYQPENNMPIELEVKDNETVSGKNFNVVRVTGSIVLTLVASDGASLGNKWYGASCHVKGTMFGPGNDYFGGFQNATATLPVPDNKTYECDVHMPPNEQDYSMDAPVTVVVGNDASATATVTLVKNDSTIEGFLVDQTGAKVTNTFARVVAETRSADGGFGGFREAEVDQQTGSYSMSVRSDATKKYNMGFFAGFMGPGAEKGGENAGAGNLIPTPPSFEGLAVPTAGTYNYNVVAYRSDATLTGRVVDETGAPVAFAFVFATNTEEFFKEGEDGGAIEAGSKKRIDSGSQTDENGEYTLGVVGGETYFVNTGIPHFMSGKGLMPPEGQRVEMNVGDTKELNFQFGKADANINIDVAVDTGGTLPFGYCHGYTSDGLFTGGEVFNGTASVAVKSGNDWFVQCDGNEFGSNKFYRSPEVIVSVPSAGDYDQTITVEEASFEIPDAVTTSFSASEQKEIGLPDGTTLTVPAAALSTDDETVTITAEPTTQVMQTKDETLITYAWAFTATDESGTEIQSFEDEIHIDMPYDQALVEESGVPEENLIIKYFDTDSGTWQTPSSYSLNTEADSLGTDVDHFTEFATLGAASGAAQSVSGNTATAAAHALVVTGMSNAGPQVVRADKDGNTLATWFAYGETLRMGVDVVVADMDADGTDEVITMPSSNYPAQVRRFNGDGDVLSQWVAYPSGYKGGMKAAAYDMDGDGNLELVTVPASGATSDVKVWDRDGNLLSRFNAFGTYMGGAYLSLTDLTGDGTGEIVVAQKTGGSQVRVFDRNGESLSQYNAYPSSYKGGVGALNTADLDGDGNMEILTAQATGGSQVRVHDNDGSLLAQWNGYGTGFKGGVQLGVGDVDGDAILDVVTMPKMGGTAQARVFTKDGDVKTQFTGYGATKGSFSMAVTDLDGNGSAEVVMAGGAGLGPVVRTFNGATGDVLSQFTPLHAGFRGGTSLTSMSN